MMGRWMGTAMLVAAMLSAGPVSAQMAPGASAKATGAAVWKIDPTHSELTFRIRHLVSRVRGTFNEWSGSITADPAHLAGGAVEVSINTASIDTGNERRDNHLRSDDFFDAAAHPTITFRSREVRVQGDELRVAGDLTMRGVTKPVVLVGELTGVGRDGQGKQRMGFEASTKINRHDFGVSWNNAVEGGGLVLGDEVEISIVVAAVQQ